MPRKYIRREFERGKYGEEEEQGNIIKGKKMPCKKKYVYSSRKNNVRIRKNKNF